VKKYLDGILLGVLLKLIMGVCKKELVIYAAYFVSSVLLIIFPATFVALVSKPELVLFAF